MKLQLKEGEKLTIENIDGATFTELKKEIHYPNDIYTVHKGAIYGVKTITENDYHFPMNKYTENQLNELGLDEILKDRVEVGLEEFVSVCGWH